MSPPESSSESAESSQSGFLSGIEFLTGDDPNLGSFLLTIGAVTCVFIALFQFTLPAPVSHLLTAGVIIITVVSAGFAALLESLGYFGESVEEPPADPSSATQRKPWVPTEPVTAPLPPMLNFDAEFRVFADHFDGEFPPQFEPLFADYRRLKTNTDNRSTIASDLRADLNPVGAILDPDSPAYDSYERISEGLFRYLGDTADHLTVDAPVFYDGTDATRDVAEINDELGRAEVTINNEGEPVDIDLLIEFYDGETLLSSRSCPVGRLNAGATTTVDTDVFVPAAADDAVAVIQPTGQ